MRSFELLGGKYQQGEQILPGVIQTFRSFEVPIGRPVFIHRIPSNDPAAQEVAGLLSAGLIRSPAVRKMLLDVYETEPFRYIVTEPSRQCVPLLDWLEREAEHTPEADQEGPTVSQAPPAAPEDEHEPTEQLEQPPAPAALPLPISDAESNGTEPPDTEASEFARLFHEALSGKLERSRRSAAQQTPAVPAAPSEKPAPKQERKVATASAPAAPKPQMTLVPREGAARKTAPTPRSPGAKPKQKPKTAAPVAQPSTGAASPVPEPEMFAGVAQVENAGKSTLIIFLVVLGVLVALAVMFIVVFVKR